MTPTRCWAVVAGNGPAVAAVWQIVVGTSWNAARAGTIVTLICVLAAGYGFAAPPTTALSSAAGVR